MDSSLESDEDASPPKPDRARGSLSPLPASSLLRAQLDALHAWIEAEQALCDALFEQLEKRCSNPSCGVTDSAH